MSGSRKIDDQTGSELAQSPELVLYLLYLLQPVGASFGLKPCKVTWQVALPLQPWRTFLTLLLERFR